MSYARYRIFATGTGFATIHDMGTSWGGSVSGIEFAHDQTFSDNERERYERDWTPPTVPYWDGSLREAAQAEIDARDAAATDVAQSIHDAESPGGTLAGWSKREKCLLLVCYKLAQQHWPNMTKAQFLANVKAEWDAVQ